MIKVIARSTVNASKLDKALDLYKTLVNKTKTEDGCISYKLFQDIDNPNIITIIEKWSSQEALNLHTQTEHFIDLVGKLSKIKKSEPVQICQKLF